MAEHLAGKRILTGSLGNSPHKFVWYNRKPDEFASLVAGKTVGEASAKGRWMLVPIEPGYVLVFGECGGKILLHAPGSGLPAKYHLSLHFEDGSALSVTTQMWGAMELHERGQELEGQYIKGMRVTPVEAGFTPAYLAGLVAERVAAGGTSVKGLLTQEQLIPGLGNAIAQDIMWRAKLHPKQPIAKLSEAQVSGLHSAIVGTVMQAIRSGGRNDEVDLFGQPGGYLRVMDKTAVGRPCPECGTTVQKMSYMGGACYFCPNCQPALNAK
jgi:formamidopyrimidine-DNA glycosylase